MDPTRDNTIYKFFQYQIERGQAAPPGRLIGPRAFALMTISIGLVALLLAAGDHRLSIEKLRDDFGPQPRSTAAVIGVLVSIFGLLLLTATLLDQ
jgi:hypothetical protein